MLGPSPMRERVVEVVERKSASDAAPPGGEAVDGEEAHDRKRAQCGAVVLRPTHFRTGAVEEAFVGVVTRFTENLCRR